MIGFIMGAAFAIGLGKIIRGRARRGRYSHAGHAGCDGGVEGCGGATLGRNSSRHVLRSLFERLETTPGQERAILSLFDELRGNRKAVRDELKETKADLARILEGGFVDDASLDDAFARHDRLLAQLRVGFVEALRKANDALDAPQRKRLATWLQRTVGRGGWGRDGWGRSDAVWA